MPDPRAQTFRPKAPSADEAPDDYSDADPECQKRERHDQANDRRKYRQTGDEDGVPRQLRINTAQQQRDVDVGDRERNESGRHR